MNQLDLNKLKNTLANIDINTLAKNGANILSEINRQIIWAQKDIDAYGDDDDVHGFDDVDGLLANVFESRGETIDRKAFTDAQFIRFLKNYLPEHLHWFEK